MNKFYKALKDPYFVAFAILKRIAFLIKDDVRYVKWQYYFSMHKKLNIANPETYNEKLQWLKLHSKHEEYTLLVDKYEVKEYVANLIGKEHVIPTIGIWDSFDDIDFSKLPNQFVLKCTHDSGGIIICTDKSKLSISKARKKLNKCLRKRFFYENREYPYKNVRPRIIAEEYMVDESGTELKDYKFFCFNGQPKMLFVATDRPYDTRFDFYDLNFNHLPFKQGHPWATKEIKKPKGFDEMIRLAGLLSKDIPHVRVDFYDVNGKVYFGELTFFHFGGIVPFEPEEWDYKIGEWLDLSNL